MTDSSHGLAALRQATHDIHADFESRLKIALPSAQRHDYRLFIEAMWGWLFPFEHTLWQAAWPDDMHAEQRDGKCTWLRHDMLGAGLSDSDIGALPLVHCTLDLESSASRFGVAYVLEGAQLGSQVLLRRLGDRLAPWPTRWLIGYGEACGTNWRQFMQSANVHLADEATASRAAASARATFLSLQTWFVQRGAA